MSFDLSSPKINTLSHIFDHTVKQVMPYESEIWGATMANILLMQKGKAG